MHIHTVHQPTIIILLLYALIFSGLHRFLPEPPRNILSGLSSTVAQFHGHARSYPPCTLDYLAAAADRAFKTSQMWEWGNNSCHLDCYLVVQLAFWACLHLQLDEPTAKTVFRHTHNQDIISAIVETLLFAGNRIGREDNRDNLWKRLEQNHADLKYGQMLPYTDHIMTEKLARKDGGMVDLDGFRVVKTGTCLQCQQRQVRSTGKLLTLQPVWYTIPDTDCMTKDSTGRLTVHQPAPQRHATLGSFVAHVLTCSDGEPHRCSNKHCPSAGMFGTVACDLIPSRCVLPKRLTITVGTGMKPSQTFIAEDTFTLGNVNYKHVAVTYANASHFVSRVKFGNNWYAYNDMGLNLGRWRRLAIIETTEKGIQELQAPRGYTPACYTYIRMDSTLEGVSPVGLVVKQAKQFNSMDRIWDGEE